MTLRSNNSYPKLTVVGLIAMACLLAGCGRKANLDLPPSASVSSQTPGPLDDTSASSSAVAQGNLYEPSAGGEKPLVAPKGAKKRIILDSLLD